MEELQQRLEKAEQSKEAIEAAVRAAMTSQLGEEIDRAVAAEKKLTTKVQQQLETVQRTAESLRSEKELAVIRVKDALREEPIVMTWRRRRNWPAYKKSEGRSEFEPWNSS